MAEVNVALELFGLSISLLLLVCCLWASNGKSAQTACFVLMLALNAAVLLCDALTWLLSGRAALQMLLYGLNFLVYSLGYGITAAFTYYLTVYIARKTKVPGWFPRCIAALCAAAVALVAVSLVNHMYFRFENGVYVRGPQYWISQAFPVLMIAADLCAVLRYRRTLGLRDTLVLLSYGVLPVIAMLIQIFVFGITLLYIATTISLLIIYLTIQVDQSRRLKQREIELAQGRIAVMLSQIQPHFLYNALGSVEYLCRHDPELARKTLREFELFLRGNMDSLTQHAPIPFEQELEHVRHYLAIELQRFPDKLRVEYDLETTDFCLPALTLQPVVENAVKHGITVSASNGGVVKISTRADKTGDTVLVEDNGVGFDVEAGPPQDGRNHLGLKNVRGKLEAMCGGSVTVRSQPGVGTAVALWIPRTDRPGGAAASGEKTRNGGSKNGAEAPCGRR